MSIRWPDVRLQEAGDDAARDLQKAAAAGADVLTDFRGADRASIARVAGYLAELKRALTARILGGQGLSSFKRASLQSLLNDTDRLIAEATKQLTAFAGDAIDAGADLGTTYATAPIQGAGLTIQSALPGLDAALVDTTFRATAGLLTQPMKQYADEVKKSVRRVALAGENQFDEMKRLAKVIDDRGDVAQYKAERIIRTEVGRVFNEATYARGAALAAEFPFLKKGWRAANDSRTRKGHREAGAIYSRGEGLIPFDQLFRIRVYDERPGMSPKLLGTASMRFPIDPEATPEGRLAAGATIMCRCNAFIDFDPAEYRAYTKKKLAAITATGTEPEPPGLDKKKFPYAHYQGTFYFNKADAEEWAAKYPGATIEKHARGFVVTRGGKFLGPGGWRDELVTKTPTPKMTDQPALPPAPGPPKADPAAARKKLGDLANGREAKAVQAQKDLVDQHRKDVNGLAEEIYKLEIRVKELAQDALGDVGNPRSDAFNLDAVRAARLQAAERDPGVAALRTKQQDAMKRLLAANDDHQRRRAEFLARARTHVEVDSASRPKVNLRWTSTAGPAETRAAVAGSGVDAFERMVGRALPNAVPATILTGKNTRSYFNATTGIHMGTRDASIVAHELAHALEYQDAYVHEQAVAFLVRRTKGEATKGLKVLTGNSGFKADERATKDGFDEVYAGKWYVPSLQKGLKHLKGTFIDTREKLLKWVQATEVISIGVERMYRDPIAFQAADPDFFDFIYKVVRGEATETLPDDPADWNHVEGVGKLKKQPKAKP